MVLNGFKRKSNKKYLNKLLVNRKVNGSNKTVRSLGIVVNSNEFVDFDFFKDLCKDITGHPDTFKLVAYSANENSDASGAFYGPNDFGWNGVVKNTALKAFLNVEFDLLISYYEEELLELKLITAKSKSKFKIGILQTDNRLNDLIIKTNTKEFTLFKTELKKYLTILKKSNKK